MTYPTADHLQKEVIPDLQRKMRLQDWDVICEYTDADGMEEEECARTAYGLGIRDRLLRRLTIKLNTDSEKGAAEWYDTVVHEMMHTLTTDYLGAVRNALAQLPKAVRKAVEEELGDQYEIMVESMVRAFVNAEGKNPDGTTLTTNSNPRRR